MPYGHLQKGQLVCTNCNYDGTDCPGHHIRSMQGIPCQAGACACVPFYWVEDDPMHWAVNGLVSDLGGEGSHPYCEGTRHIIIDDDGEHVGESHTPRLVCSACRSYFDIPPNTKGEWTETYHSVLELRAYRRAIQLRNHPSRYGAGRVYIVRSIERYPHAAVAPGETGTVHVVTTDQVGIKLDRIHPGLAEWDNVLWFYLSEDAENCLELLRCVGKRP